MILPDRIETGTFLAAAAITGGHVTVRSCRPDHLRAAIERLEAIGCRIETGPDWISCARRGRLKAADITTLPHPGFPTDLQAQFMALMTRASGTSRIRETIFENRFMHVQELVRLGAHIRLDGDAAVVEGVERLKGAPVMATDLRASVSLVLAGLAAEGETSVSRVYHLDPGFDRLEEKLSRVGADIARVSE